VSNGDAETLIRACRRFCRVYTRYIAADRTVKGGSCRHIDDGHGFILGISLLETSLLKSSVMIAMRMSVHHDCN
jgi:hypothetical protein